MSPYALKITFHQFLARNFRNSIINKKINCLTELSRVKGRILPPTTLNSVRKKMGSSKDAFSRILRQFDALEILEVKRKWQEGGADITLYGEKILEVFRQEEFIQGYLALPKTITELKIVELFPQREVDRFVIVNGFLKSLPRWFVLRKLTQLTKKGVLKGRKINPQAVTLSLTPLGKLAQQSWQKLVTVFEGRAYTKFYPDISVPSWEFWTAKNIERSLLLFFLHDQGAVGKRQIIQAFQRTSASFLKQCDFFDSFYFLGEKQRGTKYHLLKEEDEIVSRVEILRKTIESWEARIHE